MGSTGRQRAVRHPRLLPPAEVARPDWLLVGATTAKALRSRFGEGDGSNGNAGGGPYGSVMKEINTFARPARYRVHRTESRDRTAAPGLFRAAAPTVVPNTAPIQPAPPCDPNAICKNSNASVRCEHRNCRPGPVPPSFYALRYGLHPRNLHSPRSSLLS